MDSVETTPRCVSVVCRRKPRSWPRRLRKWNQPRKEKEGYAAQRHEFMSGADADDVHCRNRERWKKCFKKKREMEERFAQRRDYVMLL